jgi:hypothetical protein
MATRSGSGPSRGKQPAQSAARDTESVASDKDQTIELKAQIIALQEAQVKQAIAAAMAQNKMDSVEASMQQILELMKNNMTQSATTLGPLPSTENRAADSPFLSVEPGHPRPSPTPTSQPPEHYYRYKAKEGDIAKFSDRDGNIEYCTWKEMILDKFEQDQPLFTTPRDYISYVFKRTEGKAQKHLFPRYTRGPRNVDPFKSYEEMLVYLDTIYINSNQVQDSKHEYKELQMLPDQSFQEFKTKFIQLANDGEIPMADRFDDLYDKVTVPLQSQLLNQRPALNKDFNKLYEYATEFDTEVKRLNTRRNRERDARTAKAPTQATRSRQTFPSKVAAASPATTLTNPSAKPSTSFAMI